MPAYLLAIDQGTTGTTALVLDPELRVRGRGYREVAQHYPRPGWVEHDGLDILASVQAAVGQALTAAGVDGRDLAGIGITNQRETTLLWDRATGEPVHRAIVWQCRRTAGRCAELVRLGHGPEVADRTGLVLDAYFSGTKLRWLLDEVPGARERAERGELAFGTVDTWLVWHLTGRQVHATDPSNASRTLLYHLRDRAWDPRMAELLGVPREVLPAVVPNSGVVGETVAWGPLPVGVPISGMAGDQQASLFGQRCWQPGTGKNTYGTGCFLLVNTGDQAVASRNRLLTTVAWQLGDRTTYALEGSVFSAGATVQWLRDGLGLIATAAESEAVASSVPDNGGVYLVPAFVGLGAPQWDPFARGTLVGLTRGSGRAHVVRAGLEAIAYQVRDLIAGMEADSAVPFRELRVDGGASANGFLMQFQADVLGFPVVRGGQVESTALGAAMLAGLGVGVWKRPEDIPPSPEETRFTGRMDDAARRQLLARWEAAVQRSLAWEPAES